MQTAQSAERPMVKSRMTNSELAELLESAVRATNAVSLAHAGTAATLASHREHCDKDKAEIKDEIQSINTKIFAVLVFAVLNLLALSSYLIVNDKPWVKEAQAQSK